MDEIQPIDGDKMAEEVTEAVETAAENKENGIAAVDAEYLEPGAYPQPDKTCKIVLEDPIKFANGHETYTVSLFRAPTVGEISKAGGRASLFNLDDAAHTKLLPGISDPQITQALYGRMSLFDQQILMNGVISFFMPKQKSV